MLPLMTHMAKFKILPVAENRCGNADHLAIGQQHGAAAASMVNGRRNLDKRCAIGVPDTTNESI